MIFNFITDMPLGEHLLWFIGDNFMAKLFWSHYKNKDGDFFIKKKFDYSGFCNSKFASPNENMIVRIQNATVAALNNCNKAPQLSRLPNYIVVVLDNDLISYLDCKHNGIATLLGMWIQWLVDEFNSLLKDRIGQIPEKANREVFFYWVSAPLHSYFSKDRNNLRVMFNLSLDSVICTQNNMRVVKIKELWDPKDSTLVINDWITEASMSCYWRAVDATVRYNINRRHLYMAKKVVKSQDFKDTEHECAEMPAQHKQPLHETDPMENFFRR